MRDIFIGMEKCLVNDKCEFAYISDRLLRLLGYTRQDLAECLDDSFFNLIHPEDRQRVRAVSYTHLDVYKRQGQCRQRH